jgi:hypothetical protein
MARQPKNAIERRLDYLAELWNDFAANPKARLLRWLTDEEGSRMLEVFFETQNEETSELPDLFIRLNTPFGGPEEYGYALASALEQVYEESRADLEAEGIDAGWRAPDAAVSRGGIEAFAASCGSLRAHYQDAMVLLAVVLEPEQIADKQGWQWWLQAALPYVPDGVRLTCVDRVEAPLLGEVARVAPDAVVTVEPRLDMAAARRELLQKAAGQGPGADFQRLFLELAENGSSMSPAEFDKKTQAALKIAVDQRWHALQVSVHMLAASHHFGAQRAAQALEAYRNAAVSAEEAKTSGDPAGDKLLLQSRFGEAAVLFGNREYQAASELYEAIGPVAAQCGEPLLAFEGWRMAGYCWRQAGAPAKSWELYWQAMDAAAAVDEQGRRASALPFVGRDLMELAAMPVYRGNVPTIEARMAELCGQDWREQVEAALT